MASTRAELPLPAHFDPANAIRIDHKLKDGVALQIDAEQWRAEHDLQPAAADERRVHLLIIDDQVDFSFPEGALYVAGRSGSGATDAHRALVEFIYRNLQRISEITCTLDSHVPYQIFFPSAHLGTDGRHPPAHTVVSVADYLRGELRPNPAMAAQLGVDEQWLKKQFIHYCQQLEATGKHQLYLWPYHCLLGSDGHRLAGVVEEARLFHAFARGAANRLVLKGDQPLTERYSVFSEEVTTCFDGTPIPGASRNTRLMDELLSADAVLVAGLASSHCVKESLADLLAEIREREAKLSHKVHILTDCSAPVVVPGGVDFTEDAERAMAEFQEAGMRAVCSTEPMDAWLVP